MSDYAASVLAAALLQGWAMSAAECTKPQCLGCPIMVSKDGKDRFCARCDGGAKVGLPRPSPELVDPLATASHTRASSPTSSQDETESLTLHTARPELSAPDTPPTPQSNLASPVLPGEDGGGTVQPAVDPAVLAARRQQSDRASAEIGRKLLAGWTLLEDTCDSASCFGVPLMRRPSPSRTRAQKEGESNRTTDVGALPKNLVDPRRHCVSCGQEYLRESDIKLYEDYLAATQPSSSQPVASTSALPTVTRSAAASRDEDEEADEVIQHSSAAKKRRFSTQPGVSSTGKAKVVGSAGTARSRLVPQPASRATSQLSSKPPSAAANSLALQDVAPALAAMMVPSRDATPQSSSPASTSSPATTAIAALETAVATLSQHLNDLCGAGVVADSPSRSARAIAEAAESLARACTSLEEVKRLQA